MLSEPLQWFQEARYGMFIHWGAYAVAARGEWVANRENIPLAEYTDRYARNFKAENYDPEAWVELAQAAGMKYLVLTTRHHDGFCLWDTKTTPFNAVRMGPERDLVRPYVEAVRKAGLKVGFYYSFADWFHPDYPGPWHRDWPTHWPDESKRRKFVRFYLSQLGELMTHYGKIDLLWYDGCIPSPTDGARVNARIKELQPEILINHRNGEPCDFECCEQAIKPAAAGKAWEACMTLNDNWGYHAGDHNWKPARQVIRLLLETAGNAGNLLLNVGPKADGRIPLESENILREAGDWLRRNPRFLSHSTRSPFSWNNWGRITTKGSQVYLHIFNSPGTELCVAEIKNRVLSARYLEAGIKIPFEQKGTRLYLRGLPVPLRDPIATTLVLEIEGEPEALCPQTTFWIPGS